MTWRSMARKAPLPALVAVTLAIAVITMTSPLAEEDGPQAASELVPASPPPQPEPPQVAHVPVRASGAAADPGEHEAVALRPLVVTTDDSGAGQAWQAVLDRIGSPYDVHVAGSEPLDADALVRDDGVGRYHAILVSGGLLDDQQRNLLTDAEWQTLLSYQRDFDVRQVAWNTAPGEAGESSCLRPVGTDSLDDEPESLALTGEGGEVFDYLDAEVQIPLRHTELLRTTTTPDCASEPLLTAGEDIVAAIEPAEGGAEQALVTFGPEPDEPLADLIGYGLVRWATKGVMLGEHRHWLNVDVDDWFAATERRRPDGQTDKYLLTASDAESAAQQQRTLRTNYPLAGDFTLNLPYNGSGLDVDTDVDCDTEEPPATLSAYSWCHLDQFRWVNHTLNHPKMNHLSYADSYREINDNLARAAAVDMPVPTAVLKTPEYSGLGVYDPGGSDTADPTDFGLEGSNSEFLAAASDLGIRYVHGNMSFDSHQPDCFNCGIDHPLQPDVMIVPDWPTDVAFAATSPDEQVAIYNERYGADGTHKEDGAADRDYDEYVDIESDVAIEKVLTGSAYAFTLHQGNLREYADGRSLTYDFVDAVLEKYSSYYSVPLRNPDWAELAGYVDDRTDHFAALDAGADPVWNRRTDEITHTPPEDGTLFITGLHIREATSSDLDGADVAESYGSDTVTRVGLSDGESVTFTARPRS